MVSHLAGLLDAAAAALCAARALGCAGSLAATLQRQIRWSASSPLKNLGLDGRRHSGSTRCGCTSAAGPPRHQGTTVSTDHMRGVAKTVPATRAA